MLAKVACLIVSLYSYVMAFTPPPAFKDTTYSNSFPLFMSMLGILEVALYIILMYKSDINAPTTRSPATQERLVKAEHYYYLRRPGCTGSLFANIYFHILVPYSDIWTVFGQFSAHLLSAILHTTVSIPVTAWGY
ncbi:hypothetical protein BGZ47_006343 [Haplosporangium gracile]|nr:hypothetical protein BGZ47_006343 [Haplosporangium gracile]